MKFKYKNLSKSLLCMLMPAMVACGGKSNGADNVNDPAMQEKVRRLDSLETLYNQENASEKVYHDEIIQLGGMMYDINLAKRCESDEGKEDELLVRYETDLLNQMWDKMIGHQTRSGFLAYEIKELQDSVPAQYRQKSAADSIKAEYDANDAAEHMYVDMMLMVMRDYINGKKMSKKQQEYLAEYRLHKTERLSWPAEYHRKEKKRLMNQLSEMQNTK